VGYSVLVDAGEFDRLQARVRDLEAQVKYLQDYRKKASAYIHAKCWRKDVRPSQEHS
jgi:cell division protein FtsB